MSQAKQLIESLVDEIFSKRVTEGQKQATEKIEKYKRDYPGWAGMGITIMAQIRARHEGVVYAVESTVEELERCFRESGRRDGSLFWELASTKLGERAAEEDRRGAATAQAQLPPQLSVNPGTLMGAHQQNSLTVNALVQNRVREQKAKAQFFVLKTPDDRRANGIPDVAVMMWFPAAGKDTPEAVEAARLRYEAFRKTVSLASVGQASVNKIDDPGLVPQERISVAVEIWLQKSVVVICDLAGQRHNVYYEFGYTRAAGTDVILTCPEEEMKDTKLHLSQMQLIVYKDLADLEAQLVPKLRGLLSKYDLSGSSI